MCKIPVTDIDAASSPPMNALHVKSRVALLSRRLMAMVYDGLLLAALWLATATPIVLILGGRPDTPLEQHGFQLYLLAVAFAFFGGFWRHGGQTLGMRAWRLRCVNALDSTPSWRQSAIRFAVALLSWLCVGLGFLWSLWDRYGRTWHDLASGTHLVVLPKVRRKSA